MNPATSSRRYPHPPICLNMYHTETLMNSWFPPNSPVASTVSVTILTRPAGIEIRMLASRWCLPESVRSNGPNPNTMKVHQI